MVIRRAQAEFLRRRILEVEEVLPRLSYPEDIQKALSLRSHMLWHWTRLTCSKWPTPERVKL
jgi:hypothetical protein